MTQAFEGIRVVDFSQVLAGPYATAQLALLGAEVVKIEQPGVGDQIRRFMANPAFAEKGLAPGFLAVNPGKRSLALDLKHEQAAEIVRRLVRQADVVIENFRAGVIDRLGFGYDALAAVNPSLIYCSISGYGQDGPKRGAAAYDGAIQAASGMMAITGSPESGPLRAGFTAVDFATGMTAAFAIAGALYRRRATGEGQFLDVAMFDCALNFLSPQAAGWLNAGVQPGLVGNRSPTGLPTGDVFRTRDGHIQISALTDRQTAALCAALGRAELLDDPRFADRQARIDNADAMHAVLAEAFAADDTTAWEARLGDAGVPFSLVQRLSQSLAEPGLAARGSLLRQPAPPGLDGEITIVNAGFTASADGPGTEMPAPALGQHTDEILAEVGYDAAEIAALRAAGVIDGATAG